MNLSKFILFIDHYKIKINWIDIYFIFFNINLNYINWIKNLQIFSFILNSPSYAAVRKEDTSGSQIWLASFEISPCIKSLAVDSTESKVYLAALANPVVVLTLSGENGAIINQISL